MSFDSTFYDITFGSFNVPFTGYELSSDPLSYVAIGADVVRQYDSETIGIMAPQQIQEIYESLSVNKIVVGNVDQPSYENMIGVASKRVYCYAKSESNLIAVKSTLAFNTYSVTGV